MHGEKITEILLLHLPEPIETRKHDIPYPKYKHIRQQYFVSNVNQRPDEINRLQFTQQPLNNKEQYTPTTLPPYISLTPKNAERRKIPLTNCTVLPVRPVMVTIPGTLSRLIAPPPPPPPENDQDGDKDAMDVDSTMDAQTGNEEGTGSRIGTPREGAHVVVEKVQPLALGLQRRVGGVGDGEGQEERVV